MTASNDSDPQFSFFTYLERKITMTASNDSDPHRKNGAKNLKLLFSGITCVL